MELGRQAGVKEHTSSKGLRTGGHHSQKEQWVWNPGQGMAEFIFRSGIYTRLGNRGPGNVPRLSVDQESGLPTGLGLLSKKTTSYAGNSWYHPRTFHLPLVSSGVST